MCVNDRHNMTLAVKVALNPNTTKQPIICTVLKDLKNRLCVFYKLLVGFGSLLSYAHKTSLELICRIEAVYLTE